MRDLKSKQGRIKEYERLYSEIESNKQAIAHHHKDKQSKVIETQALILNFIRLELESNQ